MTPTPKHLEVLSEKAIRLVDRYVFADKHFKRLRPGDYFMESNYVATTKNNLVDLLVEFTEPLQKRIDELESTLTRLQDSAKRQRGDYRLDEIEGKDY